MISARGGVHRVRNNSLPGATSGNVNRDWIIDKHYPNIYSTFVDVERLKTTGRNLREDVIRQGKNPDELPRKFLDIGEF